MQFLTKSQPKSCRRRESYFKILLKGKYPRLPKIITTKKNEEEIVILSDIKAIVLAIVVDNV